MARKKRRGRPGQGRPHKKASQTTADLLPNGPQGASPACEGAASRGRRPPTDAKKEKSDYTKVESAGAHVNGEAPHAPRSPRYSWDSSGIIWHRQTRDGIEKIHLTNFVARIISDITRDDGVEVTRHYEIAATLGETPYRFTVPANQFKNLGWVAEHLGASALVEPGQGMQARLPHAIQVISGEISARHVYTHTGWREIDGRHYFLHAGGALGAIGPRLDIEVDLPEQLSRVALFEPESDHALKAAVCKSLLLYDLASVRISVPLLAAAYRAPLGGSDVTVAPWGKTGGGKTASAAIIQQHFGPQMDAQHLPLHWESTANTIEAVLSAAKDVPIVVDEYVPGESAIDRAKLQSKAERVIRAVGNASGRGRMRADLTLRPARPPRCQLISTGEEVPLGQSLRARMISAEVRTGDTDWDELTAAQVEAAAGTYATAMAGYIMWLAEDLGSRRQLFEAQRLAIRAAVPAQHKRVADAIAQLAAAWGVYLLFAMESGAIEEVETREGIVWAGLMEVAAEQAELQRAAEPVGRFRDLLIAALATGKAHVAAADAGGQPPDAKQWGWQCDNYGWNARGECIGWLEGDHIYLEPDVAYATASRIGAIGISCETLGARLADAKVTVLEAGTRRLRPKRTIKGKRMRVWHIRTIGWLYPTDRGAIGADGARVEKIQLEEEVSDVPH